MKNLFQLIVLVFCIGSTLAVGCRKDERNKGCTNAQYANYDPEAEEDDGSCCTLLQNYQQEGFIAVFDSLLDTLPDGSPITMGEQIAWVRKDKRVFIEEGPCQPNGAISDCMATVSLRAESYMNYCDSIRFPYRLRFFDDSLPDILFEDTITLVGGETLYLTQADEFCAGYSIDSVEFSRTGSFIYYH